MKASNLELQNIHSQESVLDNGIESFKARIKSKLQSLLDKENAFLQMLEIILKLISFKKFKLMFSLILLH